MSKVMSARCHFEQLVDWVLQEKKKRKYLDGGTAYHADGVRNQICSEHRSGDSHRTGSSPLIPRMTLSSLISGARFFELNDTDK